MRLSIRSSAFLMVLVPTLIPALALSAWFTAERVRDARAELEARGERESRYLAEASELALLVGDADTLQRLAASNIKAPGAARAVLFIDNQHAVLAAAGTPWEIGLALQCWRGAADCRGGEERRVFGSEVRASVAREGGGAFGAEASPAGPTVLGSVVLSFDPQALLALQRALLRNAVLTTVAALLLAAIIASLFSRRLSEPMQRLSAVVARIRSGELGARTVPRGTGELRELEEGVNAMADRVEAASAELNRRIDEATSELSGTMVELERQNRELDAALARAEAAARAKDLFLARMSHELRTPLSTVTGFARLMQQSESPEQRADFYRAIAQASRILQCTVDDILDFVRLESGSLPLERREFDVEGCVEDALMMLAPEAQARGLDLVCHIGPGLPVTVAGDSLRLSQVLTNLVSNAIKFTRKGQVVLAVRTLRRDTEACRTVFEVRDTGIGIAPENITQLFQPFAQADESITRRFGGSGLGLSISRSIVRALGGTIDLTSEPERGTRVCVELPLEEVAGEMWPDVPRAGEVALLASRDSPQLPVLRDYLAQAFERVSWCDAGESSATPSPDARLLVVLEDRPGCVASRWAGSTRPLLQLRPVEVERGEASVHEGEVLRLPLRRRELLSACVRLRDGSATSRAAPASVPSTVPALHGLRCLLVEDNELNRRMIAIGLRSAGVEVVEAGNGLEALQCFAPGTLDIALLDVHMPEMDGATLAARLGALDPALPLYALTANVVGSEEQALAEAGVREVLYKPLDEQRLLALLRRHAPSGETTLRPMTGVGAHEVSEECARLLGQITEAVAAQEYARAAEAAHQLLGVARMFTHGALLPCCERLETALRSGAGTAALEALLQVRQGVRRLEGTAGGSPASPA